VIEQRFKRPKTELQPEPEPEPGSAAPEGAEREAKPEPTNLVRLSYAGGILDPAFLALLESAGGANIAHQVNAAGTSPGGLAAEVVRKFPYASVHTDGPQKHLLGTVRIDAAPVELKGQKVTVLSMYGQRKGGKPRKRGDFSADREANFAKALTDIRTKAPSLESIAFPENIGCGIGGGDWRRYEEMILDFASAMPRCTVYIVHYGA
jgi:O-acetyl-ADP-ribose deacetylase (regulator of RNase III)